MLDIHITIREINDTPKSIFEVIKSANESIIRTIQANGDKREDKQDNS